jgi:putative SOS response-associated peptidase YedK
MCGRFVIGPDGRRYRLRELDEHGMRMPRLRLALERLPFRPDVRPSEPVPVLTRADADELVSMQWWLVPFWAKDPDAFRRTTTTFNAKVERIAEAPAYRAAWRAGRRCLLPMWGYYEWQPMPNGKRKQRYYIAPHDGEWLWAAGVWERWVPRGDGVPLLSCSMIVRPAGDELAPIHERAPALVPAALARDWLAASPDEAMALLQAIEPPHLDARAVDGPIALPPAQPG